MNTLQTPPGQESQPRLRKFAILILLVLFTIQCSLPGYDLVFSPDEISGSATAAMKTNLLAPAYLTNVARLQTKDAGFYLTLYAPEQSITPGVTTQATLTNTPPVILYVDFPTIIPADGSSVRGTIKFTDLEHDVVLVIARVLSATGNFDDAQWDPRSGLEYHPDYGLLQFWTWCEGNQLVTQRITLKDSASNESDPVDITFTCQ